MTKKTIKKKLQSMYGEETEKQKNSKNVNGLINVRN